MGVLIYCSFLSGCNRLDPEAPLEMSQAFTQVIHINMVTSHVKDDVKKGLSTLN